MRESKHEHGSSAPKKHVQGRYHHERAVARRKYPLGLASLRGRDRTQTKGCNQLLLRRGSCQRSPGQSADPSRSLKGKGPRSTCSSARRNDCARCSQACADCIDLSALPARSNQKPLASRLSLRLAAERGRPPLIEELGRRSILGASSDLPDTPELRSVPRIILAITRSDPPVSP